MEKVKSKPIIKSRTVQFAAVKPLLLAGAVLGVRMLASKLGLQLDDENIQLLAETAIAALPFLVPEIWLRFQASGSVTVK
jgi:hypothetical protein